MALRGQDVFSENNFTQVKYTPFFNTAFRELTRVYKEQTTAWWKVQSLVSYIANNIVPSSNPVFMNKWEQEATAISIKFMHLLLEEEKSGLVTLESQLKGQIDITRKLEQESEYLIKEKQLQGTLERFQFHIKERKHKQFLRD